jgi:hypothetical protein
MTTRSSENASITGSPEISFTENKLPINESEILNNEPLAPENEIDPLSKTSNFMEL